MYRKNAKTTILQKDTKTRIKKQYSIILIQNRGEQIFAPKTSF